MNYTVQVRAPGKRYRTVLTTRIEHVRDLRWVLEQFCVPGSQDTVRIINDHTGRVVAKAWPKVNP